MKKILLSTFAGILLASCGGGESKEKADKPSKGTDITANPDYEKGLGLIANNNCMTCHAIDNAVTGPAYREVAKKYADYPDTIVAHLAKKIIEGGSGVWGPIMMTPNSGVSQADAEAMVKYILLLKK